MQDLEMLSFLDPWACSGSVGTGLSYYYPIWHTAVELATGTIGPVFCLSIEQIAAHRSRT